MTSWITAIGAVLLVAIGLVGGRVLDVSQYSDDVINDLEDAMQIIRILNKPRTLSRPDVQFSWSDCGTSSSLVHVSAVSVAPSPLVFPGNVTLGFTANVLVDLPSAISVSLTLKKKIAFFWVEVPCIDHIGSCSYDNICSFFTAKCPSAFKQHGIPCQCPVKKGTYNLPNSPIVVNIRGVPSGDYQITANIHNGDTNIGCLYVEASVD